MSVYKGDKVVAGGSVDTYFVRKPAWSQAESITIAQLQAGYTVPKNGMLVGYIHTASASTLRTINVNNVPVAVAYGTGADISIGQFQVEVNAGDVVTYPAGTVTSSSINFVPFEDSTIAEPEVVTPELIRNLHDPDWSQAVAITGAQLQSGYTAPKRGIIIITGRGATASASWITVNNVKVGYYFGGSSTVIDCQVNTPVNSGDIIKSSVTLSVDFSANFVPYKAQ